MVIKSRQVSEYGNLIGRKKKLEIISKQLQKIQKEEQNTLKEQAHIEKEVEKSKYSLDIHHNSIKVIENKISQLEAELIKNHLSQSQTLENISFLKQDLIETEKIITDSEKSLQKLKPGIKKAENSLAKFQAKVDKANEDVAEAGKIRDSQQQILQDARIDMVNIESKKENLIYKSSSASEHIEDIISLQNNILDEEKLLNTSKSDFDQKIKDGEYKLEKTNAQIQKQRSIIDLKQSVYRETYNTIDQIQTKIKLEQ